MAKKKTAAKKTATKIAPPGNAGVGQLTPCRAGRPLLAGLDVCRRCQVAGLTQCGAPA